VNTSRVRSLAAARLRVLWALIRSAWPTWVGVGGFFLAIGLGWWLAWLLPSLSPTAARIRNAGMVLQLLGVSMVAAGLSKVRREFGRPSLLDRVGTWCKGFAPLFRWPRTVSVSVPVLTAGSTALTGKARVRGHAGPNAPIQHRLSTLEANVDLLQQEINDEVRELREALVILKEHADRENSERRSAHEELRGKVEEFAVGGLSLETLGVVWLWLGVIGTSIPDELASLLHRLL
jgi:hypothetical protein